MLHHSVCVCVCDIIIIRDRSKQNRGIINLSQLRSVTVSPAGVVTMVTDSVVQSDHCRAHLCGLRYSEYTKGPVPSTEKVKRIWGNHP